MKNALKALFGLAALFYAHAATAATTLLPNGMQCFSNADGPIASGSVNMFYANTTTPKTTWTDSGQVTQNTQPIQLDASGCAVIYGVGQYRQQVYTGPVVAGVTTGTQVWDQLTTDTSAFNSVFWAGIAAGTPNTITVTDTGFNGTDGSQINFVAVSTNTGTATLNPSGFGATTIVKDTTGGPTALTGGEIVTGNIISVVYYTTDNRFHLINTAIASASGATSPLCGASGLTITNNSGTPSTIINLTASQAVMQSAAGLVINRSSISLSAINISTGTVTSTANGMDGEAVGTSQWLYIWLIDNGSAAAGLVSTSSTAPTLPSGYTYKCRMGAMKVDGAGALYRTKQLGRDAVFTLVTGSNTATWPVWGSGNSGTCSTTVFTSGTTVSKSLWAPATATSIEVLFASKNNNATSSNVCLAANNAVTYTGSLGNLDWVPAQSIIAGAPSSVLQFSLLLEGTALYYAGSNDGAVAAARGWRDSVNAN